jgi:hypothetical protein
MDLIKRVGEIMWPEGKKFAFTIVDDTDNSTIENVGPIYKLLEETGIFTTKTVWVYPPRDSYSGDSLSDPEYLKFVKKLEEVGFEIALHNVGSGEFTRKEILQGFEDFNTFMGFYPNMQINHASNKDNIYWGNKRFTVVNKLIKMIYGDKRSYYGEDPNSKYFWGDASKKHIKFIRNLVFTGINTLKYDPKMPYKIKSKEQYSNYWFSSSDAHTVQEFNDLLTNENLDKLENEQGCCIIYTHFTDGFMKDGQINEEFKNKIKELSRRNGWFVPTGRVLNHLLERKQNDFVSNSYLAKLDVLWILERIIRKVKYKR